jgi:hypothetical protein
MKSSTRFGGAAALAFVVCLSLAPVASAGLRPGDRLDVRAKIAKILKKLKGLPSIWTFEDQPGPPHPKP